MRIIVKNNNEATVRNMAKIQNYNQFMICEEASDVNKLVKLVTMINVYHGQNCGWDATSKVIGEYMDIDSDRYDLRYEVESLIHDLRIAHGRNYLVNVFDGLSILAQGAIGGWCY